MEPMKPMKPMDFGPKWWPDDLGEPGSSGSQNDVRYAFFPDSRRLVVEQNDKMMIYDTGDHEIRGVSQRQGYSLAFTSQRGDVEVDDLRKV
jgi:hypothetical protein